MLATFKQFDYDIIQLQNEEVTEYRVTELVKQLSQYMKRYKGGTHNSDGTYKAIVFAFAGHGKTNEQVVSYSGKSLSLKMIMEPLVKKEMIGDICHKIPKLFWIDACRGKKLLRTREDLNEIDGNYRRDYATIKGHVAFDCDSWISALARTLRDQSQETESYQNVVDTVNASVYHQMEAQRPQSVGQLTTGPLNLYYKEC